jgi:hypothetical protein
VLNAEKVLTSFCPPSKTAGMNVPPVRCFARSLSAPIFAAAVATFMSLAGTSAAVDPTKFYFWAAGATEGDYVAAKSKQAEGYVVEVDAQIADQICGKISDGYRHVGVGGQIAPGSVDYDRNYSI